MKNNSNNVLDKQKIKKDIFKKYSFPPLVISVILIAVTGLLTCAIEEAIWFFGAVLVGCAIWIVFSLKIFVTVCRGKYTVSKEMCTGEISQEYSGEVSDGKEKIVLFDRRDEYKLRFEEIAIKGEEYWLVKLSQNGKVLLFYSAKRYFANEDKG